MENRNIKAVCFDVGETLIYYDGTQLNWKDHYHNALLEICNTFNVNPEEESELRAEATLLEFNTRENPRIAEFDHEVIFSRLVMDLGIKSGSAMDVCKPFFRYFQRKAGIYNDTLKVLKELKNKNIPVGVLTDVPYGMPKEFVMEDLKTLVPYIDVVVTSVDAGFRKPHAAGFQLLSEYLNVPLGDMVYVGNEQKDIDGSLNAGATAVLIDRNRNSPEWHQHYTINTLFELEKLLS